MPSQTLLFIGFNVLVVILLVLDLGVFNRKAHVIKLKEALLWSCFWIILALIFNAGIYYFYGSDAAIAFLTGFLIEKSLSVDNLFVFLVIFLYFKVNPIYQHKVLFWGILGAIITRGAMIAFGITLINYFNWIIYVFGALLIISGVKLSMQKDKEEIHPEKNPFINLFKKLFPVTQNFVEGNFFVKINGRIMATPLVIVLIMLETTDILFAVDSVPAVLAITTDPFIVYTSNIFAILGLRALYFVLADIMQMFCYLNYGLSLILIFVGSKMIMVDVYHIPTGISLLIIACILAVSVIASVIKNKRPI